MILDDDAVRAILNLATFVWLLVWAIKGARNLLSMRRDSVSFLLIVHFGLCGVPLLLDETIGEPDFLGWPGFAIAAADGLTAVVYCLYVSVCPCIWWWLGRSRAKAAGPPRGNGTAQFLRRLGWQTKTVLHLIALSPVLALLAAPNPGLYSRYAAVLRESLTPEELAYHPALAAATLLSATAGAALLVTQSRLKLTCAYVLPLMILLGWVNGKRHIVLIAFVMSGIALWSRGALSRRTVTLMAVALGLSFGVFSAVYQGSIRGFNEVEWSKRYSNIRLDYGRDHVIRMTLHAELHPEAPPILEYRFQSLLFNATMLIPRRAWPEKPWPYAIYATAAAFHVPVRSFGWGITTSWLEEAVANLSWAGLLIGPLSLAWLCRVGDAQQDLLVWLLTVLVASMLLAVQVGAFWPLVVIWLSAVMGAGRLRSASGSSASAMRRSKPLRCSQTRPPQAGGMPVCTPATQVRRGWEGI